MAACTTPTGTFAHLDAYSRAVTTVVDVVGPAVVSIAVGKRPPRHWPEREGAGSGVVIAPDGYVIFDEKAPLGAALAEPLGI